MVIGNVYISFEYNKCEYNECFYNCLCIVCTCSFSTLIYILCFVSRGVVLIVKSGLRCP